MPGTLSLCCMSNWSRAAHWIYGPAALGRCDPQVAYSMCNCSQAVHCYIWRPGLASALEPPIAIYGAQGWQVLSSRPLQYMASRVGKCSRAAHCNIWRPGLASALEPSIAIYGAQGWQLLSTCPLDLSL